MIGTMQWLMSTFLPRKRTNSRSSRYVRLVPLADIIAPHSITSSARSRIGVGRSIPIALAVFRLTTISNLVGCSIGRS
jgi:hypothetical protein